VKALLDTHVLLWFAAGDRRLSVKWRRLLEGGKHELYVSAVSGVEISTKFLRGKLRLESGATEFIALLINDLRLLPLSLTLQHALQVAELPLIHHDPFDRMLVAQALVEGIPILSRDAVLRGYSAPVIW
jgi:PIN domain nuclease of toxin-antitoxin system